MFKDLEGQFDVAALQSEIDKRGYSGGLHVQLLPGNFLAACSSGDMPANICE